MSKPIEREEVLSDLFDAAVEQLTTLVRSGEASAQDYKNIIQLLKDNGINCEVRKGTPLSGLAEVLPFSSDGSSLRVATGKV